MPAFWTIKKSDLVYLDTLFSGLVKARVATVEAGGRIVCVVTSTKARAYRRGETVLSDSVKIITRGQVFRRSGHYMVAGGRIVAIPDAVIDGTAQWSLRQFYEHIGLIEDKV